MLDPTFPIVLPIASFQQILPARVFLTAHPSLQPLWNTCVIPKSDKMRCLLVSYYLRIQPGHESGPNYIQANQIRKGPIGLGYWVYVSTCWEDPADSDSALHTWRDETITGGKCVFWHTTVCELSSAGKMICITSLFDSGCLLICWCSGRQHFLIGVRWWI